MKQLYDLVGISKQAHHQHLRRVANRIALESQLLSLVDEIRKDHPCMGARDIYHMLQPEGIGRDRFEALLLNSGYRIKQKRNHHRTTFSQNIYNFPNRINGLELDGPNQLWQTDITYFRVGNQFCYLSFIQDVYTRQILGYCASENLKAEANLKALKMALRNTRKHGYEKLIHHSDRGKQFIETDYLKTLLAKDITLSHAYDATENAYVERLNGIIKNDYLYHYDIKSFKQLQVAMKKVIKLYNNERPHKQLPGKATPNQVEKLNLKYQCKLFNNQKSFQQKKKFSTKKKEPKKKVYIINNI